MTKKNAADVILESRRRLAAAIDEGRSMLAEDASNVGEGRETDTVSDVTMDVNLLIRLLEIAREDLESDDDLHALVERVRRSAEKKGRLTIDDLGDIET